MGTDIVFLDIPNSSSTWRETTRDCRHARAAPGEMRDLLPVWWRKERLEKQDYTREKFLLGKDKIYFFWRNQNWTWLFAKIGNTWCQRKEPSRHFVRTHIKSCIGCFQWVIFIVLQTPVETRKSIDLIEWVLWSLWDHNLSLFLFTSYISLEVSSFLVQFLRPPSNSLIDIVV